MLKPIIRKKRNYKNLALSNTPTPESVAPPTIKSAKEEAYDQLYQNLNDLEIGLELRLDLREEDIENIKELGAGNGGTVYQVMHVPSKTIMAKKVRIRFFFIYIFSHVYSHITFRPFILNHY
jgi:hypothetical protein